MFISFAQTDLHLRNDITANKVIMHHHTERVLKILVGLLQRSTQFHSFRMLCYLRNLSVRCGSSVVAINYKHLPQKRLHMEFISILV
jgi:hypothetical protein